ncbi:MULTISPECIES: hypothetical protein [Nocardia]|uniref:hypothetical protein n=1 Tax=Nocardia TaxID=1817 RepID=UPI00237D6449|nr:MULTISPECIES: hypothetical protein [Nocardia]MDE1669214.1 hypothetical protein [Nocardia gipuzkoensis]
MPGRWKKIAISSPSPITVDDECDMPRAPGGRFHGRPNDRSSNTIPILAKVRLGGQIENRPDISCGEQDLARYVVRRIGIRVGGIGSLPSVAQHGEHGDRAVKVAFGAARLRSPPRPTRSASSITSVWFPRAYVRCALGKADGGDVVFSYAHPPSTRQRRSAGLARACPFVLTYVG